MNNNIIKSVSSGPHIDMSISNSVMSSNDDSTGKNKDEKTPEADTPKLLIDSADGENAAKNGDRD